jgi:RNA polymerase sigma factor (sigma-70 family)
LTPPQVVVRDWIAGRFSGQTFTRRSSEEKTPTFTFEAPSGLNRRHSRPRLARHMHRWTSHLHRLMQLLRRRGRTPEEAEDLVQEAFLRLHVFLQEGKEVRESEAFLVRTVLNLSVDTHRREHRDLYVEEAVENLPLVDLAPAPEEILAAEQRLKRMRQVLDTKVSPRTREVYFLHRLEGYTYDEIGHRMHMSSRTVEKHIARAVTALWVERQQE